jgi:P27 family predicted phage terminase small subunit
MKQTRKKVNPITPAKGRPAPPVQLTGEASEEFRRVCEELEQMGTLTTSDRSIISLYVKAWERWMKAEQLIADRGEIVAAPKTKVPMQNPWVSISIKAHEQCVKLLGELGLSPRSRSIIAKNAALAGGDDEKHEDFSDLD